MEEPPHPAKHPLILFAIVMLFAVLGGILGHFSHDFGPDVDETPGGAFFGGCFGIGVAMVWALIVELFDRQC